MDFYAYLQIANIYCDHLIYQSHFFYSIALPVPIVTITREGAPIIGESFSIICNATIENKLSPNINLTWVYNDSRSNGIIITSNSDSSLSLNVNPVQESHEGLYTCIATVTIPDVPQQIIRNEKYGISILGQFQIVFLYKTKVRYLLSKESLILLTGNSCLELNLYVQN